MELNDFQKKTVAHIVDYYKNHNVYLLADETGLGKTIIASEVIQRLCKNENKEYDEKNVVYIASNLELAKENIEKKLYFQGARVVKGRLSMLWDELEKAGKDSSEARVNLFALTPEVSLKLQTTGTVEEREKCERKYLEIKNDGLHSQQSVVDIKTKIEKIRNDESRLIFEPMNWNKEYSFKYQALFYQYRNNKPRYLVSDDNIGMYKDILFSYEYSRDMELMTKIMISICLHENVFQYMKYENVSKELDEILTISAIKNCLLHNENLKQDSVLYQYISNLWGEGSERITDNFGNAPEEMVRKIADIINTNWKQVYEEIESNDSIFRKIRVALMVKYKDEYYKLIRCYMAVYSLEQVKPDIVIIDEIQNYPEIFNPNDCGEDEKSEIVKLVLETVLGKEAGKDIKVLLLSATPYAYRNAIPVEQDSMENDDIESFSKHLVGMNEILAYMKERNHIDSDIDIKCMWENSQRKMKELMQEDGDFEQKYQQCKTSIDELAGCMKELGISRTERPCKSYKPTEGKETLDIEKVGASELFDYYVKNKKIFGSRLVMSLPRANAHEYLAGKYKQYNEKDVEHIFVDKNIPASSSRITAMLDDLLGENAYLYLFMPPNLPQTELTGVFEDKKRKYGKTILFSAYNAVPPALKDEIDKEIDKRLIQFSGFEPAVYEEKLQELRIAPYPTRVQADSNTIAGYCIRYAQDDNIRNAFVKAFSTNYAKKVILAIYKDDALDDYWNCVDQYCIAGNFEAVMKEFEYMCSLQKDKPTVDAVLDNVGQSEADTFCVTYQSLDGSNFEEKIRRFNSPFYPFSFLLTSVAEEGHDFHWYSDRIIHWNVPSTPIALIQREGRIDRADCYAVRKAIAKEMDGNLSWKKNGDWQEMISEFTHRHEKEMEPVYRDMFPKFLTGNCENEIFRMCYYYPMSNEHNRWKMLMKNLEYYRSMFGACENIDMNCAQETVNGENWEKLKELKLDLKCT